MTACPSVTPRVSRKTSTLPCSRSGTTIDSTGRSAGRDWASIQSHCSGPAPRARRPRDESNAHEVLLWYLQSSGWFPTMPPRSDPPAPRSPHWHRSAARTELLALYGEADALLEGWTCACTSSPSDGSVPEVPCCHFAVTGREPYPTAVELEEVRHAMRAAGAVTRDRRKLPLARPRAGRTRPSPLPAPLRRGSLSHLRVAAVRVPHLLLQGRRRGSVRRPRQGAARRRERHRPPYRGPLRPIRPARSAAACPDEVHRLTVALGAPRPHEPPA